MHAVIQDLIEAEGQARGVVEAARAEADRLVAEAEHRARERLAQTRRDSTAEAAGAVAAAIEAAEREKTLRLDQAAADIERRFQLDDATRERLADAVVRCICGLT